MLGQVKNLRDLEVHQLMSGEGASLALAIQGLPMLQRLSVSSGKYHPVDGLRLRRDCPKKYFLCELQFATVGASSGTINLPSTLKVLRLTSKWDDW